MTKRRWTRLLPETRRQIIRLSARGKSIPEIMEELDVTHGVVFRVLEPFGGVIRIENWTPSDARLSLEERIEIKLGLERGWSLRKIGHSIGRHASTVCRELAANGGGERYRPMPAHARAGKAARRPKATKLAANVVLRERVISDLEHLWSPMQISKRLRCAFADHVDLPRDDLQVAVRSGARRAAQRARAVPSHRAQKAQAPRSERNAGNDPRHGHDQRSSAGG